MRKLEVFLGTLGEETGKILPPYEAEALVAEAREHLEDSIQARLELGMSPEEAERESLLAFGATREVAREVRRREPRIDRSFAAVSVGILLFFAWIIPRHDFPIYGMAAYAFLHLAYFVFSARAKRPQLLTLAMIIVPLWLGFALVGSLDTVTVFAPDSEGGWALSRGDVPQRIQTFEAQAQTERAHAASMIDAYTRYVKGESDLVLPRGSFFDSQGRLRLKPQPDHARGEAQWRKMLNVGLRMTDGVAQEQWQRALAVRAAADRPWWIELVYQLGPAADKIQLLPMLSIYGGGHLLFWAIGYGWRRRRPRRDPLTLV